MTDKEHYLEFWGYTPGTPEAEEAWRIKCEHTNRQAPMVAPDLPGYESPITGKWVEGRSARREDLRRTGCRPYEGRDVEQREYARQQQYAEKKQDAARYDSAARTFYALPESKRRALTRG